MPNRERIAKVSTAYAWYHAVGNSSFESPFATFVVNTAHPRVRSANHVSHVTASTAEEIAAVFDDVERYFRHCPQRSFFVDCFTPPEFVARLAFDDYREQTPIIQMSLLGGFKAEPAQDIRIHAVANDEDWRALRRLAELDFEEGIRSGGGPLDADVAQGLIDGYRRKTSAAQFFMAEISDVFCAYGSAVTCPNGVGILEDFFTLPGFRNRGIGTAIMSHCVEYLHRRDLQIIFVGALATGRAKNLYARLGFSPLMTSSEWVKG
jgi:GNAT superfamily N-acetyltransferase